MDHILLVARVWERMVKKKKSTSYNPYYATEANKYKIWIGISNKRERHTFLPVIKFWSHILSSFVSPYWLSCSYSYVQWRHPGCAQQRAEIWPIESRYLTNREQKFAQQRAECWPTESRNFINRAEIWPIESRNLTSKSLPTRLTVEGKWRPQAHLLFIALAETDAQWMLIPKEDLIWYGFHMN